MFYLLWYIEIVILKAQLMFLIDQLGEYVKQFPKNTEIIVYCAHYSCPASRRAWHLLNDLGYTNVYAYEGGIAEWYQQGFPVEGPCKEDYLNQQHAKASADEDVKTISISELKKKLNI